MKAENEIEKKENEQKYFQFIKGFYLISLHLED